jgi:ribosome-associated protein
MALPAMNADDTDSEPPSLYDKPSKSQRKRSMHERQDLGDALVALRPDQLTGFDLPEVLLDAILLAQKITAHEGRRRQLQYVGRLMREVEPEPIRARLEEIASGPREDAARHRLAEEWRTKLLADGEAGLAEFVHLNPAADASVLRKLINEARVEKTSGAKPHALRALYRAINKQLAP